MAALEIDLPRKARDTLLPQITSAGKRVRWRVLYGGRDSAKSHSIARMLLARGRAKCERILCTREVQKSIAESVHQLLSDLIKSMGLEDFYEIQQHYIIGKNGTQIAFHGLSGQTAT
jgi:phage terminase large subunit